MSDSTQPLTLTEFLLARIAEDEADALRAVDGNGVMAVFASGGRKRHLDRWSPSRVLAECGAKRDVIQIAVLPDHQSFSSPWVDALVVMASVYSDHPDYRPEWKL